jgi:phosphoglycolate phosphatase-like HAD superfamily hydrolase
VNRCDNGVVMLAIKDFSGVIFDFDGTLVDASQAICVSFNTVLRKQGIPVMGDDEVRAMIGRPLREMFSTVFPDADREEIAGYVQAYRQVFHPISPSLSRPLPGALELLRELFGVVKTGIVTSRSSYGAVRILEGWNMAGYISTVVGIEDVSRPKPHPEPVLLALSRLQLHPESSIMIGDTTDDVYAAKGAGLTAIGITTGVQTKEQLKLAGADLVINSLFELKDGCGEVELLP